MKCNRFFEMLRDQQQYLLSKLKKLQKLLLYGCISVGVIIIIFLFSYVLFGRNKCSNQNELNLLPLIQERQNLSSFNINDIESLQFLDKNNFENFNEKYLKNTSYMKKNRSVRKGTEEEFTERLKYVLNCNDREHKTETLLIGNFWILKNYVKASHGEIPCHQTITFATHCDYTFLENIITVLKIWRAPMSVALHAPGTDFIPTLSSIAYLRDCSPDREIIRQFVTFHIYFSTRHIPHRIPTDEVLVKERCEFEPPYKLYKRTSLYAANNKILYPINVGRNIARNAALTHFILSSDLQFCPSPNLVSKFLEFILTNSAMIHQNTSRVFTLPVFAINDRNRLKDVQSKQKLVSMIPEFVSPYFSLLEPKIEEWMDGGDNNEEQIDILGTVKRTGPLTSWEPIFIGTHADPFFDERLRWEGGSDRTSQIYALCLLNYEFLILKNAFLITISTDMKNNEYIDTSLEGIARHFVTSINNEMKFMYGRRRECD